MSKAHLGKLAASITPISMVLLVLLNFCRMVIIVMGESF
jgi:hypothetical protein